MRDIIIQKSEVGVPYLLINNIHIYSKYNPLNEVKRFWDNNKEHYIDKEGIVIYGLGLGYHIAELARRVSNDFKIFVFDIDKKCYDMVKDDPRIKEVLELKNVEVKVGYNIDNINLFNDNITKYENFVVIESIFKVIDDKNIDFKNAISDFKIAKDSIEIYSEMMNKCEIENKAFKYDDIEEFLSKYEKPIKPIVVVSSGPSFDDKALECLCRYRNEISIFCVGRSLRGLVENNIYPDMFCIIDCQDLVYEHIKGLENLEIPMTFLSTANSLTVKKYNGPKYIFYNKDVGQKYLIDTGKSVATAILDIAIKINPNKIIFVGQDLAYTDGMSHSKHSKYYYDEEKNYNDIVNRVKSVNGEMIPTSEGLKVFKRWIEKKIEFNDEIKYFNCSRGSDIKGTRYVDIKNFDFILKK